ncbi:MAG TPA: HIT family protein [Planctomycetota bacterium]|nr:HIT family protein [Planctomycetota bacterium]HRR80449.1 HIT family protein [Planctomycetota bacterium]HRT96462.1 HIT family protein [Planctomycetota bacterium]
MKDPSCIFCKIIAGEIPSVQVYEDDRVVAFLDINPIAPGHTLLVPRDHYATLPETPPEVLAALMAAARPVARGLLAATRGEGFNFFQFNGACSGQEVMHLHFHVIPRRARDGVSFQWKQGKYREGEMAALGERIRGAIRRV